VQQRLKQLRTTLILGNIFGICTQVDGNHTSISGGYQSRH
jgi:hypothetical protein